MAPPPSSSHPQFFKTGIEALILTAVGYALARLSLVCLADNRWLLWLPNGLFILKITSSPENSAVYVPIHLLSTFLALLSYFSSQVAIAFTAAHVLETALVAGVLLLLRFAISSNSSALIDCLASVITIITVCILVSLVRAAISINLGDHNGSLAANLLIDASGDAVGTLVTATAAAAVNTILSEPKKLHLLRISKTRLIANMVFLGLSVIIPLILNYLESAGFAVLSEYGVCFAALGSFMSLGILGFALTSFVGLVANIISVVHLMDGTNIFQFGFADGAVEVLHIHLLMHVIVICLSSKLAAKPNVDEGGKEKAVAARSASIISSGMLYTPQQNAGPVLANGDIGLLTGSIRQYIMDNNLNLHSFLMDLGKLAQLDSELFAVKPELVALLPLLEGFGRHLNFHLAENDNKSVELVMNEKDLPQNILIDPKVIMLLLSALCDYVTEVSDSNIVRIGLGCTIREVDATISLTSPLTKLTVPLASLKDDITFVEGGCQGSTESRKFKLLRLRSLCKLAKFVKARVSIVEPKNEPPPALVIKFDLSTAVGATGRPVSPQGTVSRELTGGSGGGPRRFSIPGLTKSGSMVHSPSVKFGLYPVQQPTDIAKSERLINVDEVTMREVSPTRHSTSSQRHSIRSRSSTDEKETTGSHAKIASAKNSVKTSILKNAKDATRDASLRAHMDPPEFVSGASKKQTVIDGISAAEQPPKSVQTAKGLTKKLHILVVDDSSICRKLTSKMLKIIDKDIDVVEATNGEEAIQACKTQSFDLILMDLEMPKVNGDDTVIQLRVTRVECPIVIVTGQVLDKNGLEALHGMGASEVIQKPITKIALLQLLKEWSQQTPTIVVRGATTKEEPANHGAASLNRPVKARVSIEHEEYTSGISQTDPVPDTAVLLLDNNSINRTTLVKLIKKFSHCDIVEMSNGVEAIKVFSQRSFSLAFLDMTITGMKAEEVAVRLHNVDRTVPIIAVTGDALRAMGTRELQQAGIINETIIKPISRQKVQDLCKKYINERELLSANLGSMPRKPASATPIVEFQLLRTNQQSVETPTTHLSTPTTTRKPSILRTTLSRKLAVLKLAVVLDESAISRAIMSRVFHKLGYYVHDIGGIEEMINLCKALAETVTILFLDFDLLGRDIKAVISELRQTCGKVAIVGTTMNAEVESSMASEIAEGGHIIGILRKPVVKEALEELLRKQGFY